MASPAAELDFGPVEGEVLSDSTTLVPSGNTSCQRSSTRPSPVDLGAIES